MALFIAACLYTSVLHFFLDGRLFQPLSLKRLRINAFYPEEDPVKDIPKPVNRGIVMCLYEDVVPMGLSLIQELRSVHQNFDPIQVYHCFPEELSEMSKSMLLAQTDVKIIDGCSDLIQQDTWRLR